MIFYEFWEKYNYKTDRISCQKKWEKLTMNEKSIVHHNLQPYLDSIPDKKYLLKPFKYLNRKIFLDPIENQGPTGNKRKTKNPMNLKAPVYPKMTPEEEEECRAIQRAYEREKKEGKERMKKRKSEGYKQPLMGQRMKNNLGWD